MVKVKVRSLSRVRLFATPWTVAYQAPQSVGFSRQECWSRLPFPSPGDLPDPGIEPGSPALQADTLPSKPPGKPSKITVWLENKKEQSRQRKGLEWQAKCNEKSFELVIENISIELRTVTLLVVKWWIGRQRWLKVKLLSRKGKLESNLDIFGDFKWP